MNLADAQARERAVDLDCHILAVAPAGSGKTGLLVQRLLAALATVAQPEQVVAITFTNKAAAEIRARVLEALHAARGPAPDNAFEQALWSRARRTLQHAEQQGWDLLQQPARIQALTIDGLNAAIAAELPLFSGIGGQTRISDDARGLAEAAVEGLFDRALQADAPADLQSAARAWLRATGNRLDRLLPALCALLERREQWIDPLFAAHDDPRPLDADHLAAQHRLHSLLGVRDSDQLAQLAAAAFAHSSAPELAAAADLSGWPAAAPSASAPCAVLAHLLITAEGQLRKPGGINRRLGFLPGRPETAQLKTLLAEHADQRALAEAALQLRELPPPTLPSALRDLRRELRVLLRHLLAELRLVMGARGETDFTEVALAALNALRPEGGYGEALLKRDAQLRHLLVDEMQDTSEAQIRLLAQLTHGWQDGDGRSLFLVGDPQQSIYAFRKADVRLFQQLIEHRQLGGLTLHCVQLVTNFRADAAVVQWVNDHLGPRFPDTPRTDSGEVAFNPSVAARPAAGGSVQLDGYASAEAAAQAAVAAAQAALDRGDTVAVLARGRAHLSPVLTVLRRLGTPYSCVDIDALAALPAVRDLLACLRALWHADDGLHWLLWLRAPWVGLSWTDLVALSAGRRDWPWPARLARPPETLSEAGRQRVARLWDVLTETQRDGRFAEDLAARVRAVWQALGGPDCVPDDQRADVRRCFALIEAHCRGGSLRDAAAFDRAVEALYAQPASGRLQLMTIHRAKGLEFDTVLVVGCARTSRNEDRPLLHTLETGDGPLLIPAPPDALPADDPWRRWFDYTHRLHRRAREAEAMRLLYVALTRARRDLRLFAHGEADPDQPEQVKVPSRSLGGLLGQPFPREAGAVAHAAEVDLSRAPRAPRLPLTPVTADDGQPRFRPREQRQLRPSEGLLEGRNLEAMEDDLYAQSVGTLFHQSMERIALTGIEDWQRHRDARAQSLRSALFRLGISPDRVSTALDRILTLVDRSLDSPIGRALLAPRPWARSEYALAGIHGERWVNAVLDRCFETEDALWVVDYKTTAHPLEAAAHALYVDQARQRYRDQLVRYTALLAAHRPGKPVISAFYFVEPDRLVTADGAALPPPAY
jgi:ATP-dependent helicase/nuclease subunit A